MRRELQERELEETGKRRTGGQKSSCRSTMMSAGLKLLVVIARDEDGNERGEDLIVVLVFVCLERQCSPPYSLA